MKHFTTLFLSAALLALTGCGDTTTNTTVKKETKIDGNGNEKTKIETKTETRTTNDRSDATPTREVREIKVERKDSDPIVKVGPLEINKP
jgi:hypothetical protein